MRIRNFNSSSYYKYNSSNATPYVSSGLVLYYDAANKNSYPGSGTTWTDLSGKGSTGTLINGPTFSSQDYGSVVFDGTNDYVSFTATSLAGVATVEMWCKVLSPASNDMFFGWNQYDVWFPGDLGYNTGFGDLYGISSSTVTSLNIVNNWVHYVFEMRSDVSYTNNKIYINGVNQSLSQILGSEGVAQRTFNSGVGRIAVWGFDTSYCLNMNCSVFRIYNRVLTPSEVFQNYHTFKSRYNL